MFKKIILILALLCMITSPVFSQTGDYTTNEYFYLPDYGAYGSDEYNEYNAYMEIADNQIKANKTMGEASVDTSGTPAANDIPRFTDANTIEGLSYAELKAVLDLEIGTDIQAYDAALTSISGLAYVSPSFIKLTANDTYAVRTIAQTKTDLSINLVENTALSTWAGTENITTLGTITTGVWSGTALVDNKIPNDITIDLATLATTFTCTDNESEALACPIVFVDAATGAQGAETDGDLTYNPSTGTVAATIFSGALSGNSTTCTTASAGDAAIDFFGAGVSAVTDATACTDIEGTNLSITEGVLNCTASGYTNLTSFVDQTAWRLFYSNTDGDVVELALGADGTYLKSSGAAVAPTWETPAGSGTVTTSGTPVDDDFAKFTAGTVIEGRSYSEVRTDLGLVIGTNVLAEQTIGIADDNLLEVDDADAADNDYAKFTAAGLEGRSYAEVMMDTNPITTKTAVATLTVAEAGTVLVSCAATPYTLTLPTASGNAGLTYHFIKTDSNYFLITLDGNGAETFNYENSTGAPVLTYARLNTYCAEVTIVSDGTNWQVTNEAMGQVPECEVYLGTNQLDIANDTWVVVDLDTEVYDIGSNFNTTTHQFTAPISGKYQINAAILYSGVVADKLYKMVVREGGDGYDFIPVVQSSTTDQLTVTLSKQRVLAASEYVELVGRNTSGGSSDYYAIYTLMQIKLISKD